MLCYKDYTIKQTSDIFNICDATINAHVYVYDLSTNETDADESHGTSGQIFKSACFDVSLPFILCRLSKSTATGQRRAVAVAYTDTSPIV